MTDRSVVREVAGPLLFAFIGWALVAWVVWEAKR